MRHHVRGRHNHVLSVPAQVRPVSPGGGAKVGDAAAKAGDAADDDHDYRVPRHRRSVTRPRRGRVGRANGGHLFSRRGLDPVDCQEIDVLVRTYPLAGRGGVMVGGVSKLDILFQVNENVRFCILYKYGLQYVVFVAEITVV